MYLLVITPQDPSSFTVGVLPFLLDVKAKLHQLIKSIHTRLNNTRT